MHASPRTITQAVSMGYRVTPMVNANAGEEPEFVLVAADQGDDKLVSGDLRQGDEAQPDRWLSVLGHKGDGTAAIESQPQNRFPQRKLPVGDEPPEDEPPEDEQPEDEPPEDEPPEDEPSGYAAGGRPRAAPQTAPEGKPLNTIDSVMYKLRAVRLIRHAQSSQTPLSHTFRHG